MTPERKPEGNVFKETFLVKTQEELTELEKSNEGLYRRIKRMNEAASRGIFGINEWRQEYIRLDQQIQEGDFGQEDEKKKVADVFLFRMADHVTELDKKEKEREARNESVLEAISGRKLGLTEATSSEEQREKVRELLEDVESNDNSLGHYQNANKVAELERVMGALSPEVAAEVRARLRLQEAYALVRRISPGRVEDTILGLRDAVQELVARGHLLDGQDFDVLIKKGLPGLEIGKGLTELQKWAIEGGGTSKIKIFDKGLSPSEIQAIDKEISDGLGGGREGRKSLQLARRLAYVTFETSVWNYNAAPGDSLADAIYFKTSRKDRFAKGTDKGPSITVEEIDGFGTSFLRWATTEVFLGGKVKKEKLFNDRDWRRVDELGKTDPDRAEILIRELTSLKEKNGKLAGESLKFKDAEYDKLPPTAYGAFLSGYLPGILNVKDWLLKSDWKPDDFSRDQIMTWLGPFNSHADPTKDLRLKSLFVVGALDEGLRQPDRLGWGQFELSQAEKNLTMPLGMDYEKKKEIVFLPKHQMEWAKKVIKSSTRGFVNDVAMSFRGVVRTRR